MPYSDKENKNSNARLYYEKNKDSVRKYQNDWRANHRLQINEQNKIANANLKLEVLSHYSPDGILRCTFCEIVDIDMLTLDHVNDDGCKDRHPSGKRRGGVTMYQHIKALGFPPGYQTLCANHQLKKEILRRRNIQ